MEQALEGTIIYGDDFEPINGCLTIEDGIIKDIEERKIVPETIIAPRFVNSHTHLGDSVIKDPPYLPLEELVQPPNGLKHKVLQETPYNDLVTSMKATIGDMIKTGTCAFADFREGGITGILALGRRLVHRISMPEFSGARMILIWITLTTVTVQVSAVQMILTAGL